MDDAEEVTDSNEEDVVRQDFTLISPSVQRLRTRSWINGQYNDAEEEADNGKMKTEIRFAHNDVSDDAKEATEANKEDMVRQDFVLVSSSAQNLETRSWIYGQYDDAEDRKEDDENDAQAVGRRRGKGISRR